MKLNFNKFSLIVLITILLEWNLSLNLKKSDDLKLDDKEIENMLNDPKFANIAADLNKLKSSRAEMERAGAELKTMGVDISKKESNLDTLKSSDGLGDLGGGGLDSFLKMDLDKPKKKSNILGDSHSTDDILAKLGDFKDLGLDLGSNTKLDMGINTNNASHDTNMDSDKNK